MTVDWLPVGIALKARQGQRCLPHILVPTDATRGTRGGWMVITQNKLTTLLQSESAFAAYMHLVLGGLTSK